MNPIVGITTQKGTIPSDIKTEDFDISRKIFSKDEKSCKISSIVFRNHTGGGRVDIIKLGLGV